MDGGIMIKSIEERRAEPKEIDLTGPEGNAYVLLGYAKTFAKQLHKDGKDITNRMMSGDYENLLKVFDEEFGDFVILWR
jgi:hypothetical protein